jgi:fatty-acyl-CoA synthase
MGLLGEPKKSGGRRMAEGGVDSMRSTMPDYPLTLQHFLWRSTTLFPRKEIVTRREGGRHRYTYADFGARVAQLAHGLKDLGVSAGDRVGTLAWNNYRHLELYYAEPPPVPRAFAVRDQ